jgi:hypothetical protein
MHKARCLALALVLVLVLPAGSALADAPQIDTEASLVAFDVPTQDPCITNQAVVDILADFVPAEPSRLWYQFVAYNRCTNRPTANAIPLQIPHPLGASEFVVEPNHSGASLVFTSEARNTIAGTTEPISFNLHWASTPGVADGIATVTGTVTTDTVHIAFDNSIVWHPWGSGTFPQAGLWKCVSPYPRRDVVVPGCRGQS